MYRFQIKDQGTTWFGLFAGEHVGNIHFGIDMQQNGYRIVLIPRWQKHFTLIMEG